MASSDRTAFHPPIISFILKKQPLMKLKLHFNLEIIMKKYGISF